MRITEETPRLSEKKNGLRFYLFSATVISAALSLLIVSVLFAVFIWNSLSSELRLRADLSRRIYQELLAVKQSDLTSAARRFSRSDELVKALETSDLLGAIQLLHNEFSSYGLSRILLLRKDSENLDSAGVWVMIPEQYRKNDIRLAPEISGCTEQLTGLFFSDSSGIYYGARVPIYSAGTLTANIIYLKEVNQEFLQNIRELTFGEIEISAGEIKRYSCLPETLETGTYASYVRELADGLSLTFYPDLSNYIKFFRRSLLAILMALICGVLVSIILSTRYSRPIISEIENLVVNCGTISAGEFTQPVQELGSIRELSTMTGAIEIMRKNLRSSFSAIKKAKEDLARKVFELTLLNSLNSYIIEERDPVVMITRILQSLHQQLDLKLVGLYSCDEPGVKLLREYPVSVLEDLNIKEQINNIITLAREDQTISHIKIEQSGENKILSLVSCPIIIEKQVVGVLLAVKQNPQSGLSLLDILSKISTPVTVAFSKIRLMELATTDGLTGLYIHRYFQASLDELLKQAQADNHKLSLIMTDVDHFKIFNDTYGHQAGDRVLKEVSAIIRNNVRKEDIPARYGGEEFVVILPDCSSKRAYETAERLREKIAALKINHDGKYLNVTSSFGVAVFPDDAGQKMELVEKADTALYHSKENGRNQVSLYSEVKIIS